MFTCVIYRNGQSHLHTDAVKFSGFEYWQITHNLKCLSIVFFTHSLYDLWVHGFSTTVDCDSHKHSATKKILQIASVWTFSWCYRVDYFNTLLVMENGQVVNTRRIITSVDRAVDGADTWDNLANLAKCPTVRFVVSNTTEAGIVMDEGDTMDGVPATYPGKLTKFLYERYLAFDGAADKGVILLPVELIENNGGKLKECVLRLAEVWSLPVSFTAWLNENCIFCSTLVDRIVTGYPAAEAEELWKSLGYRDELLDVGEPFGLWVIESDREVSGELPFVEAGLPVVFTDNQKPYRERKVRSKDNGKRKV